MTQEGTRTPRWRRWGRGAVRWGILPILFLWAVAAVFCFFAPAALLLAFGVPVAAFRFRRRLAPEIPVLAAVGLVMIGFSLVPASNDRDWAPDQAVLPGIEIGKAGIRLTNLRDFAYRSTHDYTERYVDWTLDPDDLVSVDWVLETFGSYEGAAHSFLAFGFADGRHVCVSVEIRKEKGEKYSPLRGLFKQYELMYVIGTERDLIGLRANHRKDDVYLFPMRATPRQMRQLFRDMLWRAKALQERPEFYNTANNACTTNLVDHVNKIVPGRILFSLKTILPGYADELAYELGLIDTDASLESLRERHRINDLAAAVEGREDFSRGIRAGRGRLPTEQPSDR